MAYQCYTIQVLFSMNLVDWEQKLIIVSNYCNGGFVIKCFYIDQPDHSNQQKAIQKGIWKLLSISTTCPRYMVPL